MGAVARSRWRMSWATSPGYARERRPMLDVHDVKQRNSQNLPLTRANSRRAHARTVTASVWPRSARQRAFELGLFVGLRCYGPIGSLLPAGGGGWPAAG